MSVVQKWMIMYKYKILGGEIMKRNKKSSVLACVTGQYDCDRIINLASELAEIKGVQLHVLSVVKPGDDYSKYSDPYRW